MMPWRRSNQADPHAAALADRHYSRKSRGHCLFMPPGRMLVLVTPALDAVWGSSWPQERYVLRSWKTAWVCTLFRNESALLSSGLITAAVAASRWYWGEPPADGMVTFVDPARIRHKRDPGRCYRKAGWQVAGRTQNGLLVLQLLPAAMPPPEPPLGAQLTLLAVSS